MLLSNPPPIFVTTNIAGVAGPAVTKVPYNRFHVILNYV